MKPLYSTLRLILFLASFSTHARAQHLWWNLENQKDATCLYGEITVLVTRPAVYFCGANWHPGEAAGGYCGIQDNSPTERRTIFSIWDTAPALHPRTIEADPQTKFNRFGGEGEGQHTHMIWNWKPEEVFQFFVQKKSGKNPGVTDTRYYIFDRQKNRWIHSATIESPNGDKPSVATIGGAIASFLENFSGKDTAEPRVALYRLWLGSNLDAMKCLTRAGGDGMWGQLHDAYFLAAGDRAKLDAAFAQLDPNYGPPVFAEKGKKLPPIAARSVPADVVAALRNPPQAPSALEKP